MIKSSVYILGSYIGKNREIYHISLSISSMTSAGTSCLGLSFSNLLIHSYYLKLYTYSIGRLSLCSFNSCSFWISILAFYSINASLSLRYFSRWSLRSLTLFIRCFKARFIKTRIVPRPILYVNISS